MFRRFTPVSAEYASPEDAAFQRSNVPVRQGQVWADYRLLAGSAGGEVRSFRYEFVRKFDKL